MSSLIRTMKFVTLCGSLRAQSSNRALLEAFARIASEAGMTVTAFDGLGRLPHFNPDDDRDPLHPEVAALRRLVAEADAVVVSTPEYAHGLPGAFKNALDWLVSEPEFGGKNVAVLHAARGTTWALDSLREVLTTMSARIPAEGVVSLSLGSNQVDAERLLAREEIRSALLHLVRTLAAAEV